MIAITQFTVMLLSAMVPSELDIKIAIALAEAEVKVKIKSPNSNSPNTYSYFRQQSINTGVPLVVWIGQSEQFVPDCLTCRVSSFDDGPKIGVVIGIPRDGKLWRVQDIEGSPTITQIQKVIRNQISPKPILQGVICVGRS